MWEGSRNGRIFTVLRLRMKRNSTMPPTWLSWKLGSKGKLCTLTKYGWLKAFVDPCCPLVCCFGYLRQCPRSAADTTLCSYVADGDHGFRRHLAGHHQIRWTIVHWGSQPWQCYIPLTTKEVWECRVTLACRQGGRRERQHKRLDNLTQHDQEAMPLPSRAKPRHWPPLPPRHQTLEFPVCRNNTCRSTRQGTCTSRISFVVVRKRVLFRRLPVIRGAGGVWPICTWCR